MDIEFNLGQPFKPFEQLMSVFPAARLVLFHGSTTFPDADICIVENTFPQCSMIL